VIVQLGIVREVGGFAPRYAVISYADASFWSDVTEFAVAHDPVVYENAKRRAAKVLTAGKPSELAPEGYIAGGHECKYCPFTRACGVERRAVPEQTSAPPDPQFVAEVRDLARDARRHRDDAEAAEARLRETQHEIKARLRAKQLRRVAGDDFSIVWSPVKGRISTDTPALKAAATAAGVDVTRFESVGEPSDRLDVRVQGTL
jgi:hypothetical protein